MCVYRACGPLMVMIVTLSLCPRTLYSAYSEVLDKCSRSSYLRISARVCAWTHRLRPTAAWVRQAPPPKMPFGQDTPPQDLSPNLVLVGSVEKCCELTGHVLEVAQTRQVECPSPAHAQALIPKRILPFWAPQNLWL